MRDSKKSLTRTAKQVKMSPKSDNSLSTGKHGI